MKITTQSAAMSTISRTNPLSSNIPESPAPTNIRYTNTGFGQLPVPDYSDPSLPTFQSQTFQSILLVIALVLSLIGILYVLIYFTLPS